MVDPLMDAPSGANHGAADGLNAFNSPNSPNGPNIIGSVHLSKTLDDGECAGYLGMFAINPDLQAGGIGRQLLEAAEALVGREWGAVKMLMEVIPVRHELIAFYERRGYRLTGKVKPFPVNTALWLPTAGALQLARMEKRLG